MMFVVGGLVCGKILMIMFIVIFGERGCFFWHLVLLAARLPASSKRVIVYFPYRVRCTLSRKIYLSSCKTSTAKRTT